jgi:hypothetical protein
MGNHVYVMIKKINVYTLIKVLFILVALALIVFIRADYYKMNTLDRDLETISPVYFTSLVFDYIVIRLLSFGALFAAGFNLEAAMKKRLHFNKTRFILGIVILLLSLIDYYKLFLLLEWNHIHWFNFGFWTTTYLVSTRYLTLVTGALAGYLCCSSFKTDDVRLSSNPEEER